MKIKKIICTILTLAVVAALAGCGEKNDLKNISKILFVDCSGAKIVSQYDSHGGFLGDGTSFYELQFSDSSTVDAIKASDAMATVRIFLILCII